MRIKFLKDFSDIQHITGDIVVLDELSKIHDGQVDLCIGHGSYYPLKLGTDYDALPNKPTKEEFLNNLLMELKASQKRWCKNEVDDSEEILLEYPEFISSLIPQIEDILDLPQSGLIIYSAMYGSKESTKDVRQMIESRIYNNVVSIRVTNSELGCDPAPNKVKDLKVVYNFEGINRECVVPEGKTLKIGQT